MRNKNNEEIFHQEQLNKFLLFSCISDLLNPQETLSSTILQLKNQPYSPCQSKEKPLLGKASINHVYQRPSIDFSWKTIELNAASWVKPRCH